MQKNKLPLKVKLGYGVCDLGGNLFFTVMAFLLLNYLTDTVGIAAGLAGIVIMIGKIWDAVTDPVVGYVSDRTNSKWGRRRPYIFFGSFPLFITMIIMFTNPNLSSQSQLFLWGVVAFCLLNTAYTLVNIPYSSLTPELTQDFHERTSLNGYRFGFAVIGTLIGAGAALPLISAFPNKNIGFTVMGTLFGFIMMITALATFYTVKEPDTVRESLDTEFFKTYLKVFKNKPYVLILLTYALHITALTVVSSIAIYYFKYIHNNEPMTTRAMLILLVTAIVFIPISVAVSKKIGKKLAYGVGMFVFSLAIMVLFFFGHTHDVNFSLALMFFAGTGMGFTYALPYAMVPDAIEYDYLLNGQRTEGSFYGIWTFGLKIGQAVALGITGAVLSIVDYVPEVAQSAKAMFGIRLLLGPIPALIFILSLVMLYFYPINEQRYNEILDDIKKMEAKKA
ncbi:MAG: MFS transporter [Deltaproteobacteria bacterium]|nr:MFS transporter [Deltaproteobacteria bacterium]